MKAEKPNPSAAADLANKLRKTQWHYPNHWSTDDERKVGEVIAALEVQQTDTLSELRTHIEALLHYSVYRGNIDESKGWDKGIKAALKLLDSAQTAKKEGPK